MGCTAFTNILHVTLIKGIIVSENPVGIVTLGPTLLAWLQYFTFMLVIGYTGFGFAIQDELWHIPDKLVNRSSALLLLLIVPAISLLPDVTARLYQRLANPTELQRVEMAAKKAKDK